MTVEKTLQFSAHEGASCVFPLTRKQILTCHRVEPRALGLSRGALALVLCGILIGRGFTDLVVGSIREVGATTVKLVYVQSVDPFPNSRVPAPMWSIQVVSYGMCHAVGFSFDQ